MFPGARIEGPDQRPFRIRQRGQAFQHDQSRLDLVGVRGHRRSLTVFGQQTDRVAEATLRFGALGEIEEHRRVLEQPGLQLLHLRAEPHGRRGRHIGIVIVGGVFVTLLQDRVVEPRDLLPGARRHDAQPITGAQGGVQLRQLTPRLLVSQRPDTLIEQRQGLIAVALLVSRQRQVAANREIAWVQCAGALQELRRLREILRRVRLRRVGHQRLDLLLRGFGDPLQPLFGIRGEQHVLRGQILLSGLEQAALLFRVPAQAGQPLRLRFFCLPLLFVSRKG